MQTPQQSTKAQQPPPAQAQPPVAGGQQAQIPIADGNQQQQKQQQKAEDEKAQHVSGAPLPPNQRLIRKEEHVEYRDQDGNLLNEEQVKALQGKVEFKTRYETRTRIVDAEGNEVLLPPGVQAHPDLDVEQLQQLQQQQEQQQKEAEGVAPPHPDVEGAFFFFLYHLPHV